MRRGPLVALGLLPIAACALARPKEPASAPGPGGAELYARHCALCHGESGRGDGPAASWLFPPARDFGSARFRIVSTRNGVPTDDDLVGVLRRGMPGTAMPSFHALPERDLAALAGHVRALAREGAAESYAAALRADGTEPDPADVRAVALRRTTPGEPVAVPAFGPVTPELLERGREVYRQSCAQCHGEDGAGFDREPRWNEDGTLNWARDFTRGVVKGGAGREQLAQRILAGMPGTAMPPTELEPRDLVALVGWVRSLLPPGSAERLVQTRRTIVALRVRSGTDERVPWDPEDTRWDVASEVDLVLAPLAWHDDAVVAARVAALHDGSRIAVRVRWRDETEDRAAIGSGLFPDGVALQVTASEEPPVFGMGAPDAPTEIWHWTASSPDGGALDLLAPHEGLADGPPRPLRSRALRDADVPALEARGFESVEPTGETVLARPRRTADGWQVVFVRSLTPAGGVHHVPGRTGSAALAIWNGAATDGPGQKAVTIWHRLHVER